MYTIGEFSKIGKVSTKMLRHYDKIGLLLPEKINPESGYRYYSHAQVKDIIIINKLKGYKFSLKEIASILAKGDNDVLQHAMKEKLVVIKKELQQYHVLMSQMKDEIHQLEKGGSMFMARTFSIIKDQQEEMILVCVRDMISMEDIGRLFGKGMEIVYKNQLKQVGPMLTKYYDKDFDKEYTDVEICVPVDRVIDGLTTTHQPAMCVHTEFIGPYSEISEAYAALFDYLKENNLELVKAPYEKYIKGPGSGLEPKDFLTEIYFPVK